MWLDRLQHPKSPRVWDVFVALTLLSLLLLLFWRYIFTSPIPLIFPNSDLGTDLTREVWPLARFIKDSSTLPLWRPYLSSGAPLIGHPVAPIFYPPHWIILILPLPLALNLNAVAHLWWAGMGVYIFLRLHLHTQRPAAFIGALIFALSPKWIAHLSGGHYPMLAAISWWPWVWCAIYAYWNTSRLRWSVLLGIALAAQLLNHGPYLAISLITLGIHTLLLYNKSAWHSWFKKAFLGWSFALLIMVGLTAVWLLPFIELLPYTNRAALTTEEAGFGSLPPLLFLSAFAPPDLKFPEWFIYPGATVLLMIGFGWAISWSRKERHWATLAVIGVIASLGTHTPLYQLFLQLPIFNLLRVPARWWILTLFAALVLAALALDKSKYPAITPIKHRWSRLLMGMIPFYVAFGSLALVLPFTVWPSAFLLITLALFLSRPAKMNMAFILLIVIADLYIANTNLIRPAAETELTSTNNALHVLQTDTTARSFSVYEESVPEAWIVLHDFKTADGYDPFHLQAYAEFVQAATNCPYSGYSVSIPATKTSPDARDDCPSFQPNLTLLALLNVRHVVLPPQMQLPEGELVYSGQEFWIYDIGPGLGEAFIVTESTPSSSEQCIDHLLAIDPSQQAITEKLLTLDSGATATLTLGETPLSYTVVAGGNVLLVRSEVWSPGWQAKIDDVETDVLQVNCTLQGIWIPPGQHTIQFEYLPSGYVLGQWISLATAGILLLGMIAMLGLHHFLKMN